MSILVDEESRRKMKVNGIREHLRLKDLASAFAYAEMSGARQGWKIIPSLNAKTMGKRPFQLE